MLDRKKDVTAIVISICFYLFMFILGGSSVIIIVLAYMYYFNNPDVEIVKILEALSGTIPPANMSANLLKAYAVVGSLGNMLAYIATTFIVLIFMWRFLLIDLKVVFRNIGKYIIIFILSVVVFYVVTIIVDTLVGSYAGDSNNQETIVAMIQNGGALPMFVSVVLLAPILEELIYRKAIFTLLENKHIILSYIVSSILFVLPHMLTTDMTNIGKWLILCVPYTVSAVMLAGIYHVSGKNIWASWFVHAANNFLAYVSIILLMYMG